MNLSDEEFDKAEDARLSDPTARLREILDEVLGYNDLNESPHLQTMARVLREMLKLLDQAKFTLWIRTVNIEEAIARGMVGEA